MHHYFVQTELVRFAFVLGIVVAVYFYDKLHLSTGSIITPTYLGVSVLDPSLILGTLVSAFVVFAIVHRLLPRFVLQTKNAKFLSTVVVSVALQAALFGVRESPGAPWSGSFLIGGIGFVIPGLIAHDMARQGVGRTVLALLASAGIVAGATLVFVFVLPDLARPAAMEPAGTLSFAPRWIPLALLLSALAAAVLRLHGLRSGGFVGAAYLSLILVRPFQVLSIIVLTLLTHFLVTRVLDRRLILFGRRKFASGLLVGAMLSWGAILLARYAGVLDTMISSAAALTLVGVLLSGLYATDLQEVGFAKLAHGTVLSVLFTFAGTLAIVGIAGQAQLGEVLFVGGIALLSGWAIIAPHVRGALRPGPAAGPGAQGSPAAAPRLGDGGASPATLFLLLLLVAAGAAYFSMHGQAVLLHHGNRAPGPPPSGHGVTISTEHPSRRQIGNQSFLMSNVPPGPVVRNLAGVQVDSPPEVSP